MKRIITLSRAEEILENALELLEETGIEFQDGTLFPKIREKVPCVYKNQRIHFPREKMRKFFEMRRLMHLASQKAEEEKITMGGGWHSWYLCDPLNNQPHPASFEDAVKMARLAEQLGAGRGPVPVAPQGIHPMLHTLECERIALCYTEKMGGCLTATDPQEIQILKEMNQAADRRYLLALEPLISPLRLNSEVLEIYFRWRDDPDIDITIFTPIPMAGATAPLVFPAALVQTLAEALAQDYLFYQLSDGKQLDGFSLRLDAFDMRCGNIMFGSPEWCLFRQAVVELWNTLVGGKYVSGMFRTNSRCVDAQAIMERTASFMYQMEMGIRHFSAVGQMAVDEVFSPVQAILDAELVKYGNRILRGIDSVWLEPEESKAALLEGIQNHGFLEADSTLDYFRETYDMSRMTDSRNTMAWKAAGMPETEQTAWIEAQKLIECHTFAIEPYKKKEIDQLFERYASKFN